MAAKKKKGDGHLQFDEYEKLHTSVRAYEGGACINGRCVSPYKQNSCSYRWQVVKKAKQDKSYYNVGNTEKDRKMYIGKDTTITLIYEVFDSKKTKWRQIPVLGLIRAEGLQKSPAGGGPDIVKSGRRKGQEGKQKDYTIANFTHSAIPWGNQVHHIIPCAELRDAIMRFTNIFPTPSQDLLRAKYNLNHQDNVVILPTQAKYSRKTGLPKHLGSHPSYNDGIRESVNLALSGSATEVPTRTTKTPTTTRPIPSRLKTTSSPSRRLGTQRSLLQYPPTRRSPKMPTSSGSTRSEPRQPPQRFDL